MTDTSSFLKQRVNQGTSAMTSNEHHALTVLLLGSDWGAQLNAWEFETHLIIGMKILFFSTLNFL